MSTSSSRAKRTRGSAGTPNCADVWEVAMSGWCARTARARPHECSSTAQSAITWSLGPNRDAHPLCHRRIRAAKASAVSASHSTGTTFAETQQRERS